MLMFWNSSIPVMMNMTVWNDLANKTFFKWKYEKKKVEVEGQETEVGAWNMTFKKLELEP